MVQAAAHGWGQKGCDSWMIRGENSPQDAHRSCFESSLCEALEPPLLLSISSSHGYRGANTAPAYLLNSHCVGGYGTQGEHGGCLPSLPPPKNDASGSRILLLEVPEELQGAFSPCPPGVGGGGRPGLGPVGSRCREKSQGSC